jgi:[ribosomal protein S5]-alanine N-acetyltransferase
MSGRPRSSVATPSLRTQRLEIRPGSASALRAALESNGALAANLHVDVPDSWPPELYDDDAVRWTLDQLGDRVDGGPYGFYYLIRHQTGARDTLIGVGGFKGPPNANGEVELGYGVLWEFQRQGYASEAVQAWLTLAFADPAIRMVVGQTLASLTPSIGVLEKAGFRLAGAGADDGAPEGEQVVRYELARDAYKRRE